MTPSSPGRRGSRRGSSQRGTERATNLGIAETEAWRQAPRAPINNRARSARLRRCEARRPRCEPVPPTEVRPSRAEARRRPDDRGGAGAAADRGPEPAEVVVRRSSRALKIPPRFATGGLHQRSPVSPSQRSICVSIDFFRLFGSSGRLSGGGEVGDSKDIVGGSYELGGQGRSVKASEPGSSDASKSLHPAKYLLN